MTTSTAMDIDPASAVGVGASAWPSAPPGLTLTVADVRNAPEPWFDEPAAPQTP